MGESGYILQVRAEYLINLIVRFNLVMVLPAGMPMHVACSTGNLMRVDNVFVSRSLQDAVVQCGTKLGNQPVKADHFPIDMTLEWDVARILEGPRQNFCNIEWDLKERAGVERRP